MDLFLVISTKKLLLDF